VVTQGSNTRSVQGDLGKNEGPVGRLSGRESRFAQRPRSGPDLDALERPQRSWLVVRGALPLAACHVANVGSPEGRSTFGQGSEATAASKIKRSALGQAFSARPKAAQCSCSKT